MNLSCSVTVILGAVLGIAAIFLIPSVDPHKQSDDNENEDDSKEKPTIVVSDPNDKIVNEKCSKLYGEKTLWDILGHVRKDFLEIWKKDWKIIIPDGESTDSTSKFEDAKSHVTTSINHDENSNNLNIAQQPLEVSSSEHEDCINMDETEYIKFFDPKLARSSSSKGKMKDKLRDIYNGIKRPSIAKEDIFENLPRQSTLIEEKSIIHDLNTSKIKKRIPVPIGQDTLQQFENIINTKFEFSNISVENNCIVFSFERSPSPVRKIFRNVRNILRLKKNLPQKNDTADVKTIEKNKTNNNNNNSISNDIT